MVFRGMFKKKKLGKSVLAVVLFMILAVSLGGFTLKVGLAVEAYCEFTMENEDEVGSHSVDEVSAIVALGGSQNLRVANGLLSPRFQVTPSLNDQQLIYLNLMNRARLELGLSPVMIDGGMTTAGNIIAREQYEGAPFGHVRPDGRPTVSALADVVAVAQSWWMGGNAFMSSSYADRAFNAWRNSPVGHWNVIIDPSNIFVGPGTHGRNWYQFVGFTNTEQIVGFDRDMFYMHRGGSIESANAKLWMSYANGQGWAFLQILPEMITGLNPNVAGVQNVTLHYRGLSIPFQVTVQIPLWRMFHEGINQHLWTTCFNEYEVLATRGWNQEGIAWYTPPTGRPVHRLFHEGIVRHHYTADQNEIRVLRERGWNDEGVLFFCANPNVRPNEGVRMTRLFHEGALKHLHTADANEVRVLTTQHGWRNEGESFVGLAVR